MNSIGYSPDGSILATGDDFGKVKLWNASTGFSFITFSDHTVSSLSERQALEYPYFRGY